MGDISVYIPHEVFSKYNEIEGKTFLSGSPFKIFHQSRIDLNAAMFSMGSEKYGCVISTFWFTWLNG